MFCFVLCEVLCCLVSCCVVSVEENYVGVGGFPQRMEEMEKGQKKIVRPSISIFSFFSYFFSSSFSPE